MNPLNAILACVPLAPAAYLIYPHLHNPTIAITLVVSIVSFLVTSFVIPHIKPLNVKAGLFGKDLNKGEAGLKMQVYVHIKYLTND
jgi:hypothetical protein